MLKIIIFQTVSNTNSHPNKSFHTGFSPYLIFFVEKNSNFNFNLLPILYLIKNWMLLKNEKKKTTNNLYSVILKSNYFYITTTLPHSFQNIILLTTKRSNCWVPRWVLILFWCAILFKLEKMKGFFTKLLMEKVSPPIKMLEGSISFFVVQITTTIDELFLLVF